MKKITLLLILLTVSFGYSQTLPFDFETAPVTADFTNFDGAGTTVVANSQSGGINTSATVAELIRNGGEVWAGSKVTLSSTLDFSTNNSIRMKVYTDAPVGTTVAFKIENADGTVSIEKQGATTVSGAWEILEWNFSEAAAGTYNNVVFLFDLGNVGDGTATSTFLFDDVEQFSTGTVLPGLPFDFETTPVTTDFTDFDGGGATVIANPQSGGINTSATVAELIRNGGEVWAGSKVIIDAPLDFTTDNAIRMKVWTAAPIGTNVTLKLEGGGANVEVPMATTVSGAWETIEFDLTGQPSIYNEVVFLFDLGNVGDGTAASTFLFDDVEQFSNASPLDQIDLPIDFEGTTTNYSVTDFGNNASTLVTDPTDPTNMVMQTIKTAAAETWAGTTISTPTGLASPIPMTASETKMFVKVWSPDAGIPIMLKIETAGVPTQSCETLTSTAVVAGWNVLEFDFSNERTGTASLNTAFTFNVVSIFFNFGTSGADARRVDKTYYFDNVEFNEPSLSTTELNTAEFNVFPNPTVNNWNVKSTQNITTVQVFDVLGKQVLTLNPNAQDVVIDATSLNSGLYFARIDGANGTKTVKLIKK